MDFGKIGDAFAGTWFGDVLGKLPALLPFLIAGGVLTLVVVGVIQAVVFVGKGAGQLGIIEGFVGTIGAGKTTLAVQLAIGRAQARNAVLLSNIPVICGVGCKPLAGWTVIGPRLGPRNLFRKRVRRFVGPTVPAHSIEHDLLPMTDNGIDLGDLTRRAFALRDAQRGLVLFMDEVGVVMPARLWKDFSVALMWVLQQSRKLACEWIWTAQDPSFVDHQLRSLTSAVHFVRSYPPPSVWRRVHGKRPWFLMTSTYLPSDAPRVNGGEGAKDEKRRIGKSMKRYKRAWEGAFDTDGVVLPSRHLKGAEVLRQAVVGTADAHLVASDSSWGELAHGAEEPS